MYTQVDTTSNKRGKKKETADSTSTTAKNPGVEDGITKLFAKAQKGDLNERESAALMAALSVGKQALVLCVCL